MDRVAAIILAGGQGTRLFPLTRHRCKPVIPYGGRYRLIDIPLSHCINSDLKRVFVLTQFLAASLMDHILNAFPHDLFYPGKLEFLGPEESLTHPMFANGTADAVRQHLDRILQAPVDYFLILSGDQVYNWDLKEIISFAREENADLVIASLPVAEAEAKRMGLLKVDRNNHVQDFYEKPQEEPLLKKFQLSEDFLADNKMKKTSHPLYLGSMGIYLFKREALVSLLKEAGNDFGRELLPFHIKKGKTSAFLFHGYWEDIGTIASYMQANLALLDQTKCINFYDEERPILTTVHHMPSPLIKGKEIQNSIVSQGSIIEDSEISHSVIGLRTRIKKGCKVHNSIIMGNQFYTSSKKEVPALPSHFEIGENCHIENAIIDEHTLIGNNVVLINKNKLHTYDGDGIFIRDGIIIVTAGTKLPNNFSF
jgi:glucose-1-phosphate adenylyltransferase